MKMLPNKPGIYVDVGEYNILVYFKDNNYNWESLEGDMKSHLYFPYFTSDYKTTYGYCDTPFTLPLEFFR